LVRSPIFTKFVCELITKGSRPESCIFSIF